MLAVTSAAVALERLQHGTRQSVTVKHLTVSRGGQAIVAGVIRRRPGKRARSALKDALGIASGRYSCGNRVAGLGAVATQNESVVGLRVMNQVSNVKDHHAA